MKVRKRFSEGVKVDKHLTISPKLWRLLKTESANRGVTLSNLVAIFCEEGLKSRRGHRN
jgi:hypothetical protein